MKSKPEKYLQNSITFIIRVYGWFPQARWHSSNISKLTPLIVTKACLRASNSICGVITAIYKKKDALFKENS
jgi:hypothetical protein